MSSSNKKISSVEAKKIIANGKFYCPATSHYDGILPPHLNNNVYCDFCGKTMLKASIGYEAKDLCLTCADMITNEINGISSLTEAVNHMKPFTRNDETKIESANNSDDDTDRQYYCASLMGQDSVRQYSDDDTDRQYSCASLMGQDSVRQYSCGSLMKQDSVRSKFKNMYSTLLWKRK